MKEIFLILAVLFLVFGMTAIRYRKQIAAVLGMARMLKEAKAAAENARRVQAPSAPQTNELVNCSKCGVWVPRNKAVTTGRAIFYCSQCYAKVV